MLSRNRQPDQMKGRIRMPNECSGIRCSSLSATWPNMYYADGRGKHQRAVKCQEGISLEGKPFRATKYQVSNVPLMCFEIPRGKFKADQKVKSDMLLNASSGRSLKFHGLQIIIQFLSRKVCELDSLCVGAVTCGR